MDFTKDQFFSGMNKAIIKDFETKKELTKAEKELRKQKYISDKDDFERQRTNLKNNEAAIIAGKIKGGKKLTTGEKLFQDIYSKEKDVLFGEDVEKGSDVLSRLKKSLLTPDKTSKADKSNSAANLAIANIKAENEKLKRDKQIEDRVSNDLTTSKNIHQISLTVQQAIGQQIATQTINNAKEFNQEDILRSMMIVFQKQLDDVVNNFKNKNKI